MTSAQGYPRISPPAIARATALYLWGQHRLLIAASLGYLALLVVLFQTVFAGKPAEEVAGYTIPLLFSGLFWMAVFSYPQADLASPHSGFPGRLLTLPVSTRQLVLWPMLLGGVTLASLWLTMAVLVWRPVGVRLPLFWPAAMFPAALACLQAILWSPAGLPFVRVFSSVVIVSMVVAFGLVAASFGVSGTLVGWVYLAVLPAAYGVAVAGLTRARRGDSPQWHEPVVRVLARFKRRCEPTPFASAREALLWFAWRTHGVVLLVIVFGGAVLMALPAPWVTEEAALGVGQIRVNALVTHQWRLLVFPALFSVIRAGRRPDSLLLTRPLSSVDIALAGFRAAWRDVVVVMAGALGILLLWTLVPAREGDARAPLFWLLLAHLTWGKAAGIVLMAALVCAWLWKLRVQWMFVELAGRRWLTTAFNLAVIVVLVCGAVLAGHLWKRPLPAARLAQVAPHVLGVLVALKAMAAAKTLRALWRRGMISAGQLELALWCWLLATGAVFAIITSAVPSQWLSVPAKVLLAVHLVPLARLAAAPLAVEWNRHR